MNKNSVLKFYKHSSVKDDEASNLKQARNILRSIGLDERENVYSKSGGRSGDLYVVHKNLWVFRGEENFLTASVASNQRAQIYQLTMNSTNGWSQYLSTIIKGPFDPEITKQFEDLDFAPKHSYLAKNERVVTPNYGERLLWLDYLLDFDNPLSKYNFNP